MQYRKKGTQYPARKLVRDQEGGVLIFFGLGVLLLVTAIGIAIDMARYNIARTKMQHALDLAVLSAAAVRDTQDATAVANSFFNANYPAAGYETTFTTGGPGQPVVITIDEENGIVDGIVRGDIKTLFGYFIGVNTMGIDRFAEVAEDMGRSRITEVVLTLDNSPSMCQSSPGVADPTCQKLNAVKTASRNFIENLYEDNPENLYIGIVPFNHNARTISSGARHPLMGTSVWPHDAMTGIKASWDYTPVRVAQALTNNKSTLLNSINNMVTAPKSNTYTRTNVGTIAAGMMLMPYPEERSYFNHQSDLPHDFDYPMVQKVLVLMTDGENIPHWVRNGATSYYSGMTGSNPPPVPFYSSSDNLHQTQLCDKLKNTYGITIFSVVYDLPNGPIKDVFKNCATNEQFYFDANSTSDLILSYERIAENIKLIRLHK